MIELSTPVAGSPAQNAATPPRIGLYRVLRQVWSTGIGRFALICVFALMLCVLFAPWLAPHNPIAIKAVLRLKGPSIEYWLGNDQLGRDILSRLIYGTRIAMMVAFAGTGGALLLGSLLGLVDGAIIFVTHDLHLVSALCDKVAVMYAGKIVEAGPIDSIFGAPSHPYTRALLACDPARIPGVSRELPFIAGAVPPPGGERVGCPFQPRCASAFGPCLSVTPVLTTLGQGDWTVRCHKVGPHA